MITTDCGGKGCVDFLLAACIGGYCCPLPSTTRTRMIAGMADTFTCRKDCVIAQDHYRTARLNAKAKSKSNRVVEHIVVPEPARGTARRRVG